MRTVVGGDSIGDREGIGVSCEVGRDVPGVGCTGQSARNSADGLQVVWTSIFEYNGDRALSVSPGEFEGLASSEVVEYCIGEFDSCLCDSKGRGGDDEL